MSIRKFVSGILGATVIVAFMIVATEVFGSVVSAENGAKWFENNESEVVQFQGGGLSGYLRFFYAQNSLYCNISYVLAGMSGKEETGVGITITNENRSYDIYFTGDSEDDTPCGVTKCFTKLTRYGQDIYFMIELNEKADKDIRNVAKIRLQINDASYDIARIEIPGEEYSEADVQTDKEPETAKEQKTTSAQNGGEELQREETATAKGEAIGEETASDTDTEESTTKFVYTGGYMEYTAAGGETAAKSSEEENVTKFSFENSAQSAKSGEYSQTAGENAEAQSVASGEIKEVPVEKETEYSPQAKAMFGLAGLFAAIGVCLLSYRAVKSKKKQTENNSQMGADEENTNDKISQTMQEKPTVPQTTYTEHDNETD